MFVRSGDMVMRPAVVASPASSIDSEPRMTADTSWFTHDRFGLFIHWGLYSQAARHEWVMSREETDPEAYKQRYFKRFDPDLYDPKVWADAAADAGMKYFVVTTKHHEGFCLWDSPSTEYKATNAAAGRDLLRPMVDAFRERGLRTGFYHSLIDWTHPEYVIDSRNHPLRNHPERDQRNLSRNQDRYADFLHAQTRELLTEFGDVDVLWYDFSFPGEGGKGCADWRSPELVEMIRELMPKVILDDRLDLPGVGDVITPEQYQPRTAVTVDGKPVVWEACQTLSGSWGYYRDEHDWRGADELIRCLIDTVSKDGNLLLNVGPTARGEFDDRALSRLTDIGSWMRRHGRSIYGCGAAPAGIETPPDCRLTYNAETNRLYIHIFAWPYKHLHVPGLAGKVEYAQLLHDASEVSLVGLEPWQLRNADQTGMNDPTLQSFCLPQMQPAMAGPVPVIECFLK